MSKNKPNKKISLRRKKKCEICHAIMLSKNFSRHMERFHGLEETSELDSESGSEQA